MTRVPAFQTPGERHDGPAFGVPIIRLKVTAISADSNAELLECVSVNGKSAGIVGTRKYIVRRVMPHAVDDLIYACRPEGGTDQAYHSRPVVWLELAPHYALMVGKVRYKSGSMGDATTDCAALYTVYSLDGTQLGDDRAPAVSRMPKCEYVKPANDSLGILYQDAAGAWQLYSAAQEIPKGDWVTDLTAVRWDEATGYIQYKSQDHLVWETKPESDWTNAGSYEDCP